MEREQIVQTLRQTLQGQPWARALWLEGADAGGWLDEYSDFDFWLDVNDEAVESGQVVVLNVVPVENVDRASASGRTSRTSWSSIAVRSIEGMVSSFRKV